MRLRYFLIILTFLSANITRLNAFRIYNPANNTGVARYERKFLSKPFENCPAIHPFNGLGKGSSNFHYSDKYPGNNADSLLILALQQLTVRCKAASTAEKDSIKKRYKTIRDIILNRTTALMERDSFAFAYPLLEALYTTRNKLANCLKLSKIDVVLTLYFAKTATEIANYPKALELYQEIYKSGIQNPELFHNLAYVYKLLGNYESALKFTRKGLKNYPRNKILLIDLINYYMEADLPDSLIIFLNKKFDADTNDYELAFTLATVYDDLNQKEKAVEYYKKAIQLKKDYSEAYYNLGVLLYNQAIEINGQLYGLDESAPEYQKLYAKRDTLLREAAGYFEKLLSYSSVNYNIMQILNKIYNQLSEKK